MTGDHSSLMTLLLLSCHIAATFYMVGLVWFVQRVHYPLFAGVGSEQFAAYAKQHMARTGPVVIPPMLIEAATGVALVAFPPEKADFAIIILGVALLAVVWLSTWLLQVPRHSELSSGFKAAAHRRLVVTNWIRTAAWSARGILVLWLLIRVLSRAAP